MMEKNIVRKLWEYPELIDVIAEELFNSTGDYDREIYNRFFIERTSKESELYSLITDLEEMRSPKNILLIGDRGAGKTCFLDWFLLRSKYSKFLSSGSYFVDIGSRAAGKEEAAITQILQSELTRCIKDFFKKQYKDPCHDIPDKFENQFQLNIAFDKACKKLGETQYDSGKCMKMFIDDIDYIDNQYLPSVIDVLRPILNLRNCRVILAARPPAYNTIIGHSDVSMATFFGGGSHSLELDHLDVEDIVRARLHFICSDDKCTVIKKYEKDKSSIDLFKNLGSTMWRLFIDPNLPKKEEVETIKLPFTPNQYRGMQSLSNGNIRYVLAMCKEYLKYMKENPKKIMEGIKGYHIGRKAVLDHFSREEVWGRIRIHNIHVRKSYQFTTRDELKRRKIPLSHHGNSLYVVLLESLAQFQSVNSTKIAALEGYGFSEREVNEGIEELLDMEMIEEQKIIDRRPLGIHGSLIKEMKITKRGEYYLWYMMHWREYIEKYGVSEHHKRGMDHLAKESMRSKLLGILVAIILLREEEGISGYDLKVSKNKFWRFFRDITQPIRLMLDMTNGATPIPITEKDLEEYMKELKIISTKRLSRISHYLIYYSRVKEESEKRGVPWEIGYYGIYDKEKINSFIEASVITPEYEGKK